MKKSFLKVCSAVLAGAVLTTSVVSADILPVFEFQDSAVVEAAAEKVSITASGGWLESAYAEWSSFSSASGFAAYVKEAGAADSAYVQLDDELIRKYPTYFRADALGLKAGSYVIKVVPYVDGKLDESAAAVTDTLNVEANDRSGFAFSSDSTLKSASGAYNDDGTLKSDAKVFYVTKDTAKTITAEVVTNSKGNAETFTGIQAIITAKQKGYDQTPFDFRIIGTIEKDDLDRTDSSAEGLQIKGKSEASPLNITLEGVGEDATIRGFGILVRYAGNVELRNFAVILCMDDCISIDSGNANIWVHNIDFFYGAAGGDSDQAKGDGTVDIKADSQYINVSYIHTFDSGKTSLCGMTSESGPNYITYHHNWFDHSDSRHPRIRTMSVHIYNNYFDGNSKYGVGAAAGSSAFVENNVFEDCKHPMLISLQGSDIMENEKTGDPDFSADGTFSKENGGIIKAFNNLISGSDADKFNGGYEPAYYDATQTQTNGKATQFDAYLASSRDEQVPSTVKTLKGGTTYDNSGLALDKINAVPDDVNTVKSTVTKYAGRQNGGDFFRTIGKDKSEFTGLTVASDYAVDKELKAALSAYEPTLVSVGGLNAGGTVETTESTESTTSITETSTEVTTNNTITETTTETTTEAVTSNVEIGEAQTGFTSDDSSDTGAGVSVVYNNATSMWDLTDTSATAAAELTIPFAEQTEGKVTISGKAVPSVQGSKWMFVQVRGTKTDGTADEIIGIGGGAEKTSLAARGNKGSYNSITTLTAGKEYSYEIVIDLDAKTADITVDGSQISLTGLDVASISSIYSVTSKTGERNVSVSVPVINSDSADVPPVNDYIIGDADNDGSYTATDAANILQKVIDSTFVTLIEKSNEGVSYIDLLDTDNDGKVTSSDASVVLQKTIDVSFKMPCEK